MIAPTSPPSLLPSDPAAVSTRQDLSRGTPGPSSARQGRLLFIYLFIYSSDHTQEWWQANSNIFLPGESSLGYGLLSKVIPTFFFWWEKWGDLKWKWFKKPSLPWDALNAAFFLLLLFLLQRHLSLNPLSEPVPVSRIWVEMLILLTKVNLLVQSRENSCSTCRVVSAVLFFVWFWSFCKSEEDHVSGTLLCQDWEKWEGCSCMGTIAQA